MKDYKKIRVLMIVSGDLWAGAENVFYHLCSGLNKRDDVKVLAVLLNQGPLKSKLIESGINTVVFDETKNGFFSLLKMLIRIAKSFSPDVIHSHRYKENFLAAICWMFCGFPSLISTVHGLPEFTNNLQSRIKNLLNTTLLKYIFFKTVGVSEDISRHLIESHGFKEKNVRTIYNGIDSAIDDIVTSTDSMVRIGSVGRLTPVKDYPLMIDIANAVLLKTDSIKFLLAGEGPLKNHLNEIIKNKGIENAFTMAGHFDNIYEFLGIIDIFINTSIHEGFPMSVLEAMSCGKPVVAFDVGGLKEIITEAADGFLIKNRDKTLFVQKLIELSSDRNKISEMGKNARVKIMDKFSRKSMVNSYMSIYLEKRH